MSTSLTHFLAHVANITAEEELSMTDPLTEVLETIERRHARKAREAAQAPTPEELGEARIHWTRLASQLAPNDQWARWVAEAQFGLRLLDALEAARSDRKMWRDSATELFCRGCYQWVPVEDEYEGGHTTGTDLCGGVMQKEAVPELVRALDNGTEPTERAETAERERDAARRDREALWTLLDDIDTAEDMAKGNDAEFRGLTHHFHRQRHDYATSDGYNLAWLSDAAQPAAPATEATP